MRTLITLLLLTCCCSPAIGQPTGKPRPPLNGETLWSVNAAYDDVDTKIAVCTFMIQKYPREATCYGRRGQLQLERQEFASAIADLDEAIRLDPTRAAFFVVRGEARKWKGNYPEAIADFDEALRLGGVNPAKCYGGRGSVRMMQGDYDRAIADLTEAVRLDPKDFQYRYLRARAWSLQGDYARSIAGFQEAIQLDSRQAYLFQMRAWLLATCPDDKCRDGRQALADARQACELTKWSSAEDVDTFAAAEAEAGRFDAAVKWSKKAIELAPDVDKDEYRARLVLYEAGRPYRMTVR